MKERYSMSMLMGTGREGVCPKADDIVVDVSEAATTGRYFTNGLIQSKMFTEWSPMVN